MKNILFLTLLLFFFYQAKPQSTDLDKKLGSENATAVEAEYGIYNDENKTLYLNRVGQRLVAQLEKPLFDYKFHIVTQTAPNAFALPGGYIYVTTGLLAVLETEDELACIMSHEIIHSNNRHSVQQIKKNIGPKLLELPGDLLGILAPNLGAIFNMPIKTSNALIASSYSRKFENEADREGIKLATKAGYDPLALTTALKRLSTVVEVATGQEESKNIFSDHPYTPDRLATIRKEAKDLTYTGGNAVSDKFLMEFDNTFIGSNPDMGIIHDSEFLHPKLDIAITYPAEWIIDNQTEYVAASAPDQSSILSFTLADSKLEPKEASKQFWDKLDSKARAMMESNEALEINNNKAHRLTFVFTEKSEKMIAYSLMVKMNNELYHFMGAAKYKDKDELLNIPYSFRSVSDKDLENIKLPYLKVVEANQGENIKLLADRFDSQLNIELTEAINEKTKNQALKAGEYIKLVVKYPYLDQEGKPIY